MKTRTRAATTTQPATDIKTTASPTRAKRIEKRRIGDLKAFERQDATFHALEDAEFDRLIDDMRRNGQSQPIEITADNRIIDGHQRVRAARELGWPELVVWVREDVPDEQALAIRHIDANLVRRQLDPLDQVRLLVRKREVTKRRSPGQLTGWDQSGLKRRLWRSRSAGRHVTPSRS